MTQDEIIEMARQAGMDYIQHITEDNMKKFKAFAKLVAAKEREACAVLVEREWSTNQEKALCDELSAYIRARGEPTLRGEA